MPFISYCRNHNFQKNAATVTLTEGSGTPQQNNVKSGHIKKQRPSKPTFDFRPKPHMRFSVVNCFGAYYFRRERRLWFARGLKAKRLCVAATIVDLPWRHVCSILVGVDHTSPESFRERFQLCLNSVTVPGN